MNLVFGSCRCILKGTCTVLAFVCLLLLHTQLRSQSMYLPQDNKHLQFLQRLEIMLQKNTELNIASPKTINRREATFVAGMEDSMSGNPHLKLSKVDQYNLNSLLINSAEYITRARAAKGNIYNNPANFVEINKPRFFFAMNPVLGVQYGYEKDADPVYHYAGGLSMRTFIGNNLGFYASAVHNIESPPSFVKERIQQFNAVPGATYFWVRDGKYKYNDIRAGITFNVLRIFNFQVAYDRNFIGNGYRSLFLSDFAGNYLFGKASTRIWKFKYQHIYAPMIPQFDVAESPPNRVIGRSVMAIHHLSINATKWLNLALFQSITINNRLQWPYLAPIMYYPISKVTNKRPDNDIAGFEFKANIRKRAQIYGQLLFDNIDFKQITKGNGWWNNRFGVQVGAKYINLFGVNNLDLQLEMNAVRPFTYASDTAGSYTHYNQPLAHPLGANFMEGVASLKYQPTRRLSISAILFVFAQGRDTASINFGSNITRKPLTRPNEFGFTIPTGVEFSTLNCLLNFNYELFENGFLDASIALRDSKLKEQTESKRILIGTLGFRLNISKKQFDY